MFCSRRYSSGTRRSRSACVEFGSDVVTTNNVTVSVNRVSSATNLRRSRFVEFESLTTFRNVRLVDRVSPETVSAFRSTGENRSERVYPTCRTARANDPRARVPRSRSNRLAAWSESWHSFVVARGFCTWSFCFSYPRHAVNSARVFESYCPAAVSKNILADDKIRTLKTVTFSRNIEIFLSARTSGSIGRLILMYVELCLRIKL